MSKKSKKSRKNLEQELVLTTNEQRPDNVTNLTEELTTSSGSHSLLTRTRSKRVQRSKQTAASKTQGSTNLFAIHCDDESLRTSSKQMSVLEEIVVNDKRLEQYIESIGR